METESSLPTSPSKKVTGTFSDFTLSKIFEAHKQDVKKVIGISMTSILTAGRDGSLKLWTERSGSFTETYVAQQKDNVAINSAAIYLTPDDEYVIFAGRKDGSIMVYNSGKPNPIKILNDHKKNVCALYVDPERGILLSGSFDHTAAVWAINDIIQSEHVSPSILRGHSNSIWAVTSLPSDPIMFLTGSADKLIMLHDCTHTMIRTFRGHSDVVRQIQVLTTERFISVSNDSTLRIWSIESGACLQTVNSLGNEFIYDMMWLKNGTPVVVSCGEKGYVEVWKNIDDTNLELLQSMRVPSHSVWSVSPLRNGDFAVGTSSGQVYIFTREEQRRAHLAIQQAYDEQLSFMLSEEILQQEEQAKQNVVNINVQLDDSGGSLELKYVKGTDPTDAAIEFIHKNGLPMSYLDEITKFILDNVPEARVAQASKHRPQDAQRKIVDGKKYDYTFEVQTVQDKPPVIFGYNVGEDPDYAAQRFCETHNLPISFLQKLSTLLREQVPELQSGAEFPSANYHDPFTGSNRYVPGGAGDLRQNGHLSNKPGDKKKPRSHLVPLRSYFTFDREGVSSKVLQKLVEFNETTSEQLKLSDEEISSLQQIVSNRTFEAEETHLSALDKSLRWPIETIVPALDIFRIALLNEQINTIFLGEKGQATLQRLTDLLSSGSDPIRILGCRALANAAAYKSGQSLLINRISFLSSLLTKQMVHPKQNVQLPAVSALANIARILLLSAEKGEAVTELGPREDILITLLTTLNEVSSFGEFSPSCLLRLLQTIATLMWGSLDIIRLGKERNVTKLVNKVKDALHDEDGKSVARDIVEMTFAL